MSHIRLSLLLPLATFVVLGGAPFAPPVAHAQGADGQWAQITVLYTSDVKGHIEPCG